MLVITKKVIILLILSLVLILFYRFGWWIDELMIFNQIDGINQAFEDFDINRLNRYLNPDTQLVYKNHTILYSESKDNLRQVFKEQKLLINFRSLTYSQDFYSAQYHLVAFPLNKKNGGGNELDVVATFKRQGLLG